MSREYEDLMQKIADVIKKRTISLSPKRAIDYEKGIYKPFFSLIDRGGELLCMWCGNRKWPDEKGEGGDIEILRIREPELGLVTDSEGPKSWEKVTLKVMHHFGLKY